MTRLLILFALFAFLCGQSFAAEQRPNILLIMVDDMGYSDLGCYGGEVRTASSDCPGVQTSCLSRSVCNR
jgi:arylsulfatase